MLRSDSAPGSCQASNFFDDYPRFFETSQTTPFQSRLNMRYEAIFAQNRDIIEGARVLDIASHDGRWSFAALKSGAKSVVGIEGRPELVKAAEESMAAYDIEPDRYRFLCGDVFEVMANETIEVDVVLCLGFMYHTLRYNELMSRIRQCNPHHLIIDTEVIPNATKPLVQLHIERVASQANAVANEFSHGDVALSGTPSVKAIRAMARAYDFEVERRSDWGGLIRDNPKANRIGHYRDGSRVTLRCKAIEPTSD